jgi:hypothetical protein
MTCKEGGVVVRWFGVERRVAGVVRRVSMLGCRREGAGDGIVRPRDPGVRCAPGVGVDGCAETDPGQIWRERVRLDGHGSFRSRTGALSVAVVSSRALADDHSFGVVQEHIKGANWPARRETDERGPVINLDLLSHGTTVQWPLPSPAIHRVVPPPSEPPQRSHPTLGRPSLATVVVSPPFFALSASSHRSGRVGYAGSMAGATA